MRRTSSGSPTGSGPGAARMTRWTRSGSGSREKVNWVLDLDFRDYFSRLDHQWLERFVEHRIADRRVLRLIQKWLAAGVIEDGSWTAFDEGVPQGASVSPLLANVYAHYVFDLWAHQWRHRHARGDVVIVRFADDAVVGFEYRQDAERFCAELRDRLSKFNLELDGREDAADRVRAVCRPGSAAAGPWQAGDVPFSWLYAYLWEGRERALQAQADHRLEADAGQARRAQGRDRAPPASTHSMSKDAGSPASCEGTTTTTRCPTISRRYTPSAPGGLVLVQPYGIAASARR